MDNEYYKVELVVNTFNASVYNVYWSAYTVSGFVVTQDFVEEHFARWLRTQDVPVHITKYCDKVLKGELPFLYENGSAAILA